MPAARPPIPRRALFPFPLRCFARRRQKRRGGSAQTVRLRPAASIKKTGYGPAPYPVFHS
ncbi:hypothetical protein D7X33_08760 [Butyricicoccus sp. 1XD8-22]|nr:hypothetical protein D7X33_08760 [Butyricicoccus sp. 1XD8-22]